MAATESKSDTLNGLRVFKGTRVPVRNLFDYLVAGENIKTFLEGNYSPPLKTHFSY